MALSIGIIIGGLDVENAVVVKVIQSIRGISIAMQKKVNFSCIASINMVFHVPGNILKPDYEWVRTAKFSRVEKKLMIQISVPEEEVNQSDCHIYIFKAMKEGIMLAKPVFKKTKIDYLPDYYLYLLSQIEADYIKDPK